MADRVERGGLGAHSEVSWWCLRRQLWWYVDGKISSMGRSQHVKMLDGGMGKREAAAGGAEAYLLRGQAVAGETACAEMSCVGEWWACVGGSSVCGGPVLRVVWKVQMQERGLRRARARDLEPTPTATPTH
jgi:hypothetical protein